MCKTILSSKKWRSRLSITEKRIRRISRGHHERATFFYALSSVSRIESLSGCTVTLHTVVPRSPPPIPFHLFPIYRLAIFLYALANKNPLFLFYFFFEKRGWRKWMKTDLIMMILIMMILIRRGGPGKSNANNNHLLSAVECIFGLFDAIIILLPTITNKP